MATKLFKSSNEVNSIKMSTTKKNIEFTLLGESKPISGSFGDAEDKLVTYNTYRQVDTFLNEYFTSYNIDCIYEWITKQGYTIKKSQSIW